MWYSWAGSVCPGDKHMILSAADKYVSYVIVIGHI